MAVESILITGGAGFVGSSLALRFKEAFPTAAVTALDNLHRRGS
jgi:CDP-paratose 2-epimerase